MRARIPSPVYRRMLMNVRALVAERDALRADLKNSEARATLLENELKLARRANQQLGRRLMTYAAAATDDRK